MASDYWDSVFPDKQFFVIGGAHKFVLLDEGQGVNGAEMLVVLHSLGASTQIELVDFLGAGPAQEDIRVVLRRMEL